MTHFRYVIFDVDDVIVDMDQAATLAEASLVEPLSKHFGNDAAVRVAQGLSAGYATLRKQLRSDAGVRNPDYVDLRSRIERWQTAVVADGYEVKQWSRDTLLAVALEKENLPVTGAVVVETMDHYWRILAEQTRIFPDAAAQVERLRAEGVKVHLASNSDGFLRFDEQAGTFRYDPEHARNKKLDRLAVLQKIGIAREDVSCGDPVGKPDVSFFEDVIQRFAERIGEDIDVTRLLAVGDSLTNDVLPLFQLGARYGAWILRHEERESPEFLSDHPRVAVISELMQLESIQWP